MKKHKFMLLEKGACGLFCLIIGVGITGCHRSTNIYNTETSSITEQGNEDTTGQQNSAETEVSQDVMKQAALEEAEIYDNMPRFSVNAETFRQYFSEKGYTVESFTPAGSNEKELNEIYSANGLVNFEIDATEENGLSVVNITVDREEPLVIIEEPDRKEFLGAMHDLFDVLQIDYEEEEILSFVQDTKELNGMSVTFDNKARMYSQVYMQQYVVTMNPISTD